MWIAEMKYCRWQLFLQKSCYTSALATYRMDVPHWITPIHNSNASLTCTNRTGMALHNCDYRAVPTSPGQQLEDLFMVG